MKRAALQRRQSLGHELGAAVDQARLLGAVEKRAAWNVVVVGLVGLAEVGGIRVRNRAFRPHPMEGCARVEAARECDADLLAGRNALENSRHYCAASAFVIARRSSGDSGVTSLG